MSESGKPRWVVTYHMFASTVTVYQYYLRVKKLDVKGMLWKTGRKVKVGLGLKQRRMFAYVDTAAYGVSM